jgi:hypothetical protein
LEKCYPDQIKVSYMDNFLGAEWPDLLPFDIIFVQRPSNRQELDFIHRCKSAHKKVWVDYDDLLTEIPEVSPVYNHLPENQECIPIILAMADLVTVSTVKIQRAFIEYSRNVQVIKNAHNDFMFPVGAKEGPAPLKGYKVAWRGSPTHDSDWFTWRNTLRSVTRKKNFFAFGKMNEYMRSDLGIRRENFIPGMDVTRFLHQLYWFNPRIVLFPLDNIDFNKAKSNICALETIYAGGVCMVPEGFSEFTGTTIQFTKEDFRQLFDSLTKDDEAFLSVHQRHWETMLKDQILSKTNLKRLDLIKNL